MITSNEFHYAKQLHSYLSLGIALQEITDKGSEVGVMAALHARLR